MRTFAYSIIALFLIILVIIPLLVLIFSNIKLVTLNPKELYLTDLIGIVYNFLLATTVVFFIQRSLNKSVAQRGLIQNRVSILSDRIEDLYQIIQDYINNKNLENAQSLELRISLEFKKLGHEFSILNKLFLRTESERHKNNYDNLFSNFRNFRKVVLSPPFREAWEKYPEDNNINIESAYIDFRTIILKFLHDL